MIVCKHCSSKNELESRFCKSCGLELSDEDRDRAKAEVDQLVAEGYTLLGAGRTEEAALVAEKVLEDAPDFAEALSLLGMCHERNLDTVSALACYERVVELRPDSALDKIKVQQLRNALTREASQAKKPSRSLALVGAVATVIFVGSIGGIIATFVARPANAAVAERQVGAEDTAGAPFSNRELETQQPKANADQANPNPSVSNEATVGTATNSGGGSIPPRINLPGGVAPNVLPDPSGRGASSTTIGEDSGTAPIKPPVGEGLELVPSGPGGGRPNPDDPKPETPPAGAQATEPEDPMQGIEIKVHRNDPVGNGGSQNADKTDGGLTTLMKAAREQFLLSKWSSAASMYERALKAGGDPGSINQRLGQCYTKMGKSSEAIAAYSRAEAALQSQVNAGRTSSKPALEAVRQALQNLRG